MLLKTGNKAWPEHDERTATPIPTQICSNGEYPPVPQSPMQRRVEDKVNEMADERARALGVSRREFLSTSAGMATALAALNLVHGCDDGGFQMDDCATRDPEAACEALAGDYFIFDSQTHHVDLDTAQGASPAILELFGARLRHCAPDHVAPNQQCTPGELQELSRANYLKEVFLDSETTVAMMSGVPAPNATERLISNDAMAATRDLANDLGASQRCVTQGMLTPNFPRGNDAGTTIEDMEHLVNDLGIKALKVYTGAGGALFGGNPSWWLDDEEVSYPMLAEAQRLGLDVVNAHKGFEQSIFEPAFVSPRDIPKAARDWPDFNFVVFHSAVDNTPESNYFDEFIRIKTEDIPDLDNVYAELGGAFAMHVIQGPEAVGHLLGKLLLAFGSERILWGTDSIWNGSPQWQIDAL